MPRTAPRLRIASAPRIETPAGTLANARWMQLLGAIGESQSISAAARAVGLSYKAAWEAVEAMNNLAGAPLVSRSKGGKGGGGTTLTARGTQLLATYGQVAAEHARFVDELNRRLGGNRGRELRLLGRLRMMTSARNQLAGKVVAVTQGAVNDEVQLALPGGERLTATITHESVQALGLRRGVEAVALVKASSVIVGVDEGGPALKLSARNQFKGTLARVVPGAVNSEVVITLAGGQSLAAVVTKESVSALGLAEGRAVLAIFKASSVILGVSG